MYKQKHSSYDSTDSNDNIHIIIKKATIGSYKSQTIGDFVDVLNCDFISRDMTISSCTSNNSSEGILINSYQQEKNPQVSIII